MPTTQPTTTATPNASPDDIASLFNEAIRQRELLRKRWAARGPSPQEIASELEGTVLSLLIKFMRSTGANLHAIHGGMQELHERLSEIEGDITQFTPEDAEKFLALCGVVKFLSALLRESVSTTPEQLVKLQEAEQIADECEQIVHEGTLVDEEDDEPTRGRSVGDEDDEDDEDARAERGV